MITYVKNWVRRLLVRSQTVTGTDNIYIATQGSWNLLGLIISNALALGLIIAFANLIPKETYGTYKYVISFAGALSFLTLTGVNSALSRAVARGGEGLLSWSVRFQLKLNLIYTLACWSAGTYYALNNNLVLAFGLFAIGLAYPIGAAFNSYTAYLGGKQQFRRKTKFKTLATAASTAIILGVLLITENIYVILFAYAISVSLPMIAAYLLATRSMSKKQSIQEERSDLARYGTQLTLVNVVPNLVTYLDKIILFQAVGAVQVALYSLAQAIPARMKGLYTTFLGTAAPKLAQRESSEIAGTMYRRIALTSLLGIVTATAYWFIAPYVFRFVLPAYLESLDYSRTLMFALGASIPISYIGTVFRSQKMVQAIFLNSTLSRIPTLILYFVLGTTMGIWGMVWASVIGTYTTLIIASVIWEIERRKIRTGHQDS